MDGQPCNQTLSMLARVMASVRAMAPSSVVIAFSALHRWWTAEWRYHPERTYMRGGDRASAATVRER
jgi:ADP-dependent phosphofructokinase/glucokinase